MAVNMSVLDIKGETILEKFENYLEDHRKVSDIIDFLHLINAAYLAKCAFGLSEEDKTDIIEFAKYFYENFDEATREARLDEFGNEPLILRMAEGLADERWEQMIGKMKSSMSKHELEEAEKLAEKLMGFRYPRRYFFMSNEHQDEIQLPRTIPRKELDEVKREIGNLCIEAIHDRGSIVGHIFYGSKDHIFGVYVGRDGTWTPLTPEQIGTAYCTTPSGEMLDAGDDIAFIGFER